MPSKTEIADKPGGAKVGYLLSAPTLAILTDECVQTWYDRMKRGDIPYLELGTRGRRVSLTDFDNWVRKLPRKRGVGPATEVLPPVHPFLAHVSQAKAEILESMAEIGLTRGDIAGV